MTWLERFITCFHQHPMCERVQPVNGQAGTWRSMSIAVLIAVAGACHDAVRPPVVEAWTADLVTARKVLFMSLTRESSMVKGTGSLTALLVPGSADALAIVGSRRGDTLDITLSRSDGERFRFVGPYSANDTRLQGSLTGGEFANLSVSFRKP